MSDGTTAETATERALDRQREAGAALSEEEVEHAADMLLAGAEKAGSLEKYLLDYISELDVSPPHPGMKSAFWSHGIPHPSLPPDKVLSNQYIAEIWSEDENAVESGSARYLEGTPGGQLLDKLHLWRPEVREILQLDEASGNALARKAWAALSEKYAQSVDGEVIAFTATMAPWSVAYETEMPQLRRGTGPENIHFAYDLPEDVLKGLPPETHQLLSDEAIRSHLHFFAPDPDNPPTQKYWTAGYLDLDNLRSLPTVEAQRAAVLEVCARVAQLDGRDSAAEQFTEEVLSLRAQQEATAPAMEEQQPAAVGTEQTPPTKALVSGFHGVDWMPGVAVQARQVVVPAGHSGPVEPAQASPAPAKAPSTGIGE
ncbi:hypothetical protein GCM10010260_48170 [Streptomyces filipinensis]|uniref:Uncharacterized protein n=1 Tax=Streptomyces filipinensis TaxID=66887 RepID=A0A918IDM2_9ACTN|nr:hypothetical protein [Streptomyces filipinensis]GGV05371.1 hypothetical protein GCM10010260_48170 [Streptomyces filipinensis]